MAVILASNGGGEDQRCDIDGYVKIRIYRDAFRDGKSPLEKGTAISKRARGGYFTSYQGMAKTTPEAGGLCPLC